MTPKTPRWTDLHRWRYGPYADEKASKEPNYLRDKFARIAEQQQRNEAEKAEKLRPMKRTVRTG